MVEVTIVTRLLRFGPVLFGIGFLAPVIAASLDAFSVPTPIDIQPILVGLVIGIILGSLAMWRRTWI
jgi:tetrahydromethanopterin S-methyltransferase subunit C